MQATIGGHGLTLSHLIWRMEHVFGRKPYWSVDDDGAMASSTYGELAARCGRYARVLDERGPGGARVATLAWNHGAHLALMLASSARGGIVIPLNPRSSREQLDHVIAETQPDLIVHDADLAELAHTLSGAAGIPIPLMGIGRGGCDCDDLNEAARRHETGYAWPDVDEDATAHVAYTSGTTGMPKGVAYTHRSQMLHALMSLGVDTLGVRETDVILPGAPFFHANSQGLPYAALLSGASLILAGKQSGDGGLLARLVAEHQVTCLGAVPTVIHRVCTSAAAEDRTDLLDGVRILCGGSAVDQVLADAVEALGGQMIQVWGMTETSPITTVSRPRSWLDDAQRRRARTAQGVPVPCVELSLRALDSPGVVDWDGDSTGELLCRSPWIIGDYLWGTWPTDDHTWLPTGDIASIDDSGYLRIVDRLKDMIKSGGEWIPTRQLESLISSVDGVADVAVVGVPHPEWGERPIVYLVPTQTDASASGLGERISSALGAAVPRFWIPDEIHLVDSLPRTPTEKINKVALRNAPPVPTRTEALRR